MKFHSISLGLGSARLRANFEYSHVTVSLSRPVWHYQLQPPFPVFWVFNARPLDEKGEPKKKDQVPWVCRSEANGPKYFLLVVFSGGLIREIPMARI